MTNETLRELSMNATRNDNEVNGITGFRPEYRGFLQMCYLYVTQRGDQRRGSYGKSKPGGIPYKKDRGACRGRGGVFGTP